MAARRVLRFHLDLGPEVGLGHAVRCSAVADELEALGVESRFTCPPGSEGLLERALGRQATPDAGEPAFLDGYRFSGDQVHRLAPVGVFDDNGLLVPGHGLVFNGNFHADAADYASVEPSRLRLGPAYAPLRRAFQDVAPRAEEPDGPVLVCLGGADVAGHTERVLAALRVAWDGPIQVVLGAGTIEVQDRAAQMAKLPGVDVAVGVADMPVRLVAARWGVVGGGGLLLEAARCGMPAVVVTVAENQVRAAASFEALGLGVRLGSDALGTLARFLNDADGRLRARTRGPQIVDGRGARRIAEELAGLI